MDLQALFKPLTIQSLKLSNRIVMPPMTRNKSKEHIPRQDVADYYTRRAKGGVGLLITEGTVIDHKAANAYPDVPNFFGNKSLAGWKDVVDSVHAAGGKIFPQLWHVGSVRQTHSCHNQRVDNPKGVCLKEGNVPGFGPSAIPHPYIENPETPHEMTLQDIQDVITSFARAASDAKKIGFDGVEIHGAHGYLIDQFFWQHTNNREDKYGGKTIADRTLFAKEVIQAVREAVGSDFPISFRISQWKLGDYQAKVAHNEKELESWLIPLAQAGVDLFHCSTRRFWEPEFANSPLNLAGWVKKITGRPTISVGSVGLDTDFVANMKENKETHQTQNKLGALIKRLESKEFDLIAVGRALLADPYWPQKLKNGEVDSITPFSQKSLETLY